LGTERALKTFHFALFIAILNYVGPFEKPLFYYSIDSDNQLSMFSSQRVNNCKI